MSSALSSFWLRCLSHSNKGLALLLCVWSLNSHAVAIVNPGIKAHKAFVGSETCGQCHQSELKQWETSHHAKAMMQPTAENVLGDFNQQIVIFDDVKTEFTKSEDGYFITTQMANAQNGAKKAKRYQVAFTFGYTPLQQYLINIGDGKLQAFDIAWDSRPTSEGGQRWFKLLPDEDTTAESPFHWSRQTQNWNSRCADCHSTNLSKGYNPIYQRYDTTFTELNVACEACHGGGKQHVNLVNSGGYKKGVASGFKTNLKQTRQFIFDGSNPIAQPKGEATAAQINACGGCHSRRQVIGEIDPAEDYHNQYSLRLLDNPLYHPDGQIQDEVFVLGSFMQSKMHQAGVTCTNCHNAHTGAVKAQDNSLCTQCHVADAYDVEKHHHHKASSAGALCVNCHMPATTYMEVDDRRDHAFSIPAPQQSDTLETPNACNSCHRIQSNQWSINAIEKWGQSGGVDPFGSINGKAQKANVLALRSMVSYIEDGENPAIRRATLLSLSGSIPSRLSAETISRQLSDDNPMVRRAAVEASTFIPLQHRWGLLKPLIDDQIASVRFAVANQLAGYVAEVSGEDYVALSRLLREYENQLRLSQDMPAGQAAMAIYALNQGDTDGALSALNKALEIEPAYAPALLNLADLYRGLGNENKAKETLLQALKVAPDSGAVQHSFGLYWVRQGGIKKALNYLKAATETDDRSVRYAYVYGVALESTGDIDGAIDALKKANEQWPNQYDVLLSLVLYLEKADRASESLTYLSKLSAIAPNDPEVKRRLANMRREK